MGYARGRFGVEYQPRRGRSEGHPLLWFAVVAVLLVSGAFTYHFFTRQKDSDSERVVEKPKKTVDDTPGTAVVKERAIPSNRVERARATVATNTPVPPPAQHQTTTTSTATVKPPPPQPQPSSPPNPNVKRVQEWLQASADRPAEDRVRLERLLEAETKKSPTLAIDAIKRLYGRATMADLQDPLLRRLGELNLEVLFSGQNNPLVTSVTAKRGDSRDRIAHENRTTPAVIARLNPKVKWEKLKPGDTIRVLFVPSPTLVIYRKRGYADLSLKGGAFFNRYDVSVKKTARNGTYTISSESSESVRSRVRDLGITAQKRAEIEMFLAPGSRIVIADQ